MLWSDEYGVLMKKMEMLVRCWKVRVVTLALGASPGLATKARACKGASQE
jgi:hypothetical protein